MSAYRIPAAVTLTADDLIQIGLDKGLTLVSFEEALRSRSTASQEESIPISGNIITLTVDYSLTLKQMVGAGNYDWVNDFLKNNDPIEGKIDGTGQVEVALELIHFNEVVSTKEAIRRIKERGLIPAKAEHLLALGAKHPELQREFPIVALGSVWRDSRGDRYVAYLYRYGSERHLSLHWRGLGWDGYCRFLALRKS